jgi:hypothetical protein
VPSLIKQGRLLVRPSSFTGFETARTIYADAEIVAVTTEPFGETLRGVRLAEFAQTLDAFSEGGRFSVAADPRSKPKDAMLARVDPVDAEIWCLRVTAPEQTPGIRALGAFVAKDEFAVVAWHYREHMSFNDDVAEAQQAWLRLFGGIAPHQGDRIDDYLSNFWLV